MKYVKLFEEFKSPMYELKPGKVLEDHGQLAVDDVSQLEFLGKYFDSIGYKDSHDVSPGSTPTKFSDKLMHLADDYDFPTDGKNSIIFYWEIREKVPCYATKYTFYDAERPNFEDYFQWTHEYRGHKMKKFGV